MSDIPPSSSPEFAPAPQMPLQEYLNQPVCNGGKLVRGTEGMTIGDVEDDVLKGGKFVIFMWNFSLVVMSFQRGSPLTYVRSTEWTGPRALMWSIPSFILGWWGLPWGLIFTVTSLYHNCRGGKDITSDALIAYLGHERAAGVLSRAPKKSADPVLWLLRLVCLAIPTLIIAMIVVAATSDPSNRHH